MIRARIGLPELGKQPGNVSQACKIMGRGGSAGGPLDRRPGEPRDSSCRFQELHGKGGKVALAEMAKRKPVPKNRVDPAIGQAIAELAIERPASAARGSATVPRRPLAIALEAMKKRLKALEAKSAQERPGRPGADRLAACAGQPGRGA